MRELGIQTGSGHDSTHGTRNDTGYRIAAVNRIRLGFRSQYSKAIAIRKSDLHSPV